MIKKISAFVFILAGAAGVAMACARLPFPVPPLTIQVTSMDIAKAMMAGFDAPHSLHGALMMKLDDYASTAVGKNVWKENFFQGHLSFRGPVGAAAIAFFEKPCNTTAEENAKSGNSSGDGGGDGGYSGGDTSPIEGCYIVTVPEAQTCTDGICQSSEGWTELDCGMG